MEMFLAVAALSLVGVAVSTILFAAATRGLPAEPRPQPQPAERAAIPAPRFFVEDGRSAGPIIPAAPGIPIEVLLLQIERHIRLEQAAAEAFHLAPTVQSLHSRTMSPLVH